jgi:hypothetical protein
LPLTDGAADLVPGSADGGTSGCQIHADCPGTGHYCHIQGGCVVTGAKMGQCRHRPTACPENYSPVCGCDGTTYGNTCGAQAAGVNVAHTGPCSDPGCDGISCGVINDCCSCDAVRTDIDVYPPPCPAKCKQPMCGGWYMFQPVAYCVQGECLITDGEKTCASDMDCSLANDCCFCMAVPPGVQIPGCMADCFVDACTARGLSQAKARCIGGRCRISL